MILFSCLLMFVEVVDVRRDDLVFLFVDVRRDDVDDLVFLFLDVCGSS